MAETFNSLAYMLGPYVVDVMYARGQMFTSVLIIVGVLLLGALATLLCPREVKGQSLSMGTIKGSFNASKPPAPDEEQPKGKCKPMTCWGASCFYVQTFLFINSADMVYVPAGSSSEPAHKKEG
jgi:hypothetical protein